MPNYFKKILIPLDFSINTDVAVNKGVELADTGTTIHLLYVHSFGLPGLTGIVKRFITEAAELPDYKMVKKKIAQWKACIEETRNDICVHTWIVLEGSVQKAIEKKAEQLAVDLIIVGKNSQHSWFPIFNTVLSDKLAKKTGVVVLTIKPGAINKRNQTIVLPVTNETAGHKLEVISAICRKFRVKIYLVTFLNNASESPGFSASSLLQVYQYLKFTHSHVEYAVLHGHNKAKAIMEYAEKIKADILLVQPEAETRIGWPDRHISDALPLGSKVQVWAV
jgi:nucleotide-binding universal stress UspA family protein